MQCDKHVVKMVLETAQILSTVMADLFPSDIWYKPTHKNHPCVKWAASSYENFEWLLRHGQWIAEEYSYRYGKTHKSCKILNYIKQLDQGMQLASKFPKFSRTPFVLAMPDDCRMTDPVKAYRLYYKTHKAGIATWNKSRPQPEWW